MSKSYYAMFIIKSLLMTRLECIFAYRILPLLMRPWVEDLSTSKDPVVYGGGGGGGGFLQEFPGGGGGRRFGLAVVGRLLLQEFPGGVVELGHCNH